MWADQGVQLERAKEMLEKAVRSRAAQRGLPRLARLGVLPARADAGTPRRTCARPTGASRPTRRSKSTSGTSRLAQGNVEGAIRHWEKALDLKHEEPDRVREKLRRARAPVSQR